MESSAISLLFPMLKKSAFDGPPVRTDYLVNLIDSPGHIDFSSEVSTASRLCDGAVVLIDAVEGVCSQTVTVLRQTWTEKLKPLLVINKMDRLVNELKMTPEEGYSHLSRLLEQVNAVLGSFYQGERMEDDLHWRERIEERARSPSSRDHDDRDLAEDLEKLRFDEKDDEDLYFAPERNNVIFSSALDGWAFTVRQFAAQYEKKLGISRVQLEKVLWGRFYLDPKTKRILGPKHLKGRSLKPLFVQLVLEPVWAVYAATTGGLSGKGDPKLLAKITNSLNVTMEPHITRSKDPRLLLTTLFSLWIPLSTALLVSIAEVLPSPKVAQAQRLPPLLDSSPGAAFIDQELRGATVSLSQGPRSPVVAYVSKVVSLLEGDLPENRRAGGRMTAEEAKTMARRRREEAAIARAKAGTADTLQVLDNGEELLSPGKPSPEITDAAQSPVTECLVGFARIYSGTISIGDQLYALPPRFSPADPHHPPEPRKITVEGLYMWMGRNLEKLDSVPAGIVFGIRGLANSDIIKSGTLCTQLDGACNLAGRAALASQPIVRVALEPDRPGDMDKMIAGLKMLVLSDPCAEYEQLPDGEIILLTAGELHLERCLVDLRERFARCEIQASAPIVPFRETIIRSDDMREPANRQLGRGVVIGATSSKLITITLRVVPLPAEATDFIQRNTSSVKRAQLDDVSCYVADDSDVDDTGEAMTHAPADVADILPRRELEQKLRTHLEAAKGREGWNGLTDKIVSFGPRKVGPNVLIDASHDNCLGRPIFAKPPGKAFSSGSEDQTSLGSYFDMVSQAFQLATARGPLCHEPVQGVAVIVEVIDATTPKDGMALRDNEGRTRGEVIKMVQHLIHKAFLDWSPRLMLAMYSCEIQADGELTVPHHQHFSRLTEPHSRSTGSGI
jgi:ribosome assembly protein 1